MRISLSTLMSCSCILLLASTIGFSSTPQSRQPAVPQCPTLELKGPKKSGAKVIHYQAKVKNMPNGETADFEWSVNGGTILDGQRTSKLTVAPTAHLMTVSVAIMNSPEQCANARTVTTQIEGNLPPQVSVSSVPNINLPCSEGTRSDSCSPSESRSVELTANALDSDNDPLLYTWSVTGGSLTGDGRIVSWNLSASSPGTYTAIVEVDDLHAHVAVSSTTVTVAECSGCVPNMVCPPISVDGPSEVAEGQPLTFTTSVSEEGVFYNWSVSAGTITSGQGTSSITVDTNGFGGQTVTATMELGGLDPACSRTASVTTAVMALTLDTTLITGIVKDVNGQPISGAQISAISDRGFSKTSVTQSDGRYVLKPMATGTYTVTAVAASFSTGTRRGVVLTAPGDMGEANFELRRAPR